MTFTVASSQFQLQAFTYAESDCGFTRSGLGSRQRSRILLELFRLLWLGGLLLLPS